MASNAVVFKRRRLIVETVDRLGTASVEELARTLAVSAITIRRDLEHLHNEGSLIRRHGGAVTATADVDGIPEKNLSEKDVLNMEEKLRIAARAALLVEDDDIIFIDRKSTPLNSTH